METLSIMSTYLVRVVPGLVFTRPNAAARVALYLLVFVLLRRGCFRRSWYSQCWAICWKSCSFVGTFSKG